VKVIPETCAEALN